MYPTIEKKKCKKCKQANGYVTIDGMCYDCFIKTTLEKLREYEKRKEEMELKRIYTKKLLDGHDS